MLNISPDLQLPEESVTQTFGIMAKRGMGKTYTAKVMAEEMLKNNSHVVIIDPIGVWWGLRTSTDGEEAGLPIVIAGGDHADLEITPQMGEVIANLVVEEKLSLIIDLSLFRKNAQTRFMTDFSETLYHRNRNALHLILDEADAFAPQRPMPDQNKLLGAIEDIVRRGRARGIGVTMITQRPSVLNKNVLTQIEVLVALRLTAPLDQKAIEEWVKTNAEEGQREEFMGSIASLPVGTAWFWSPGWLKIFQKIKVRELETLDSSSTPKVGEQATEVKVLADVDLGAIQNMLSSSIEKVESNDPKKLKQRIAELESELRNRPEPVTRVEQIGVVARDDIETLAKAAGSILRGLGKFAEMTVVDTLDQLDASFEVTDSGQSKRVNNPPSGDSKYKIGIDPAKPGADVSVKATIDLSGIKSMKGLNKGERAILGVVAERYPYTYTRQQIGVLSGYTASGGTFKTYYSSLTKQGLIEESLGRTKISLDGMEAFGISIPSRLAPGGVQSFGERVNMWKSVLQGGENKLFEVLLERQPITRDELGELTGYTASGGTFKTYLSKLCRMEIAETQGNLVQLRTDFIDPSGGES